MEKSKGRVRNYVVSEKYSFCSMLARTLCKMQIPYLQVENEFHFDDKILRFYSIEECLELAGEVKFVGYDDKIISLEPQRLLFTREKKDLEQIFISEDEMIAIDADDSYSHEDASREKSYTKQKRKRDNVLVNQRMKQNVDISKRFINRRRNDL